MPLADPAILARREEIAAALRSIVPDGVVVDEAGRQVFDCDALAAYSESPLVVVLPKNRQQVIEVVRYANREGVPVVPRGSGTSLRAVRCRAPMASCWRWAA